MQDYRYYVLNWKEKLLCIGITVTMAGGSHILAVLSKCLCNGRGRAFVSSGKNQRPYPTAGKAEK